jgi:hypothetical protein
MSPQPKVRLLLLLAVFTLTGCATARVVSRDPDGGVVAIPENSNCWPYHYRDKATGLIKQDCPYGHVIAWEGEVPVGTMTKERGSADGGTHVTTTETRTEYRIEYRKAGAPRTVVMPALPRAPAAKAQLAGPTIVPQPLPKEPVPIAQ